MRGPRTPPARIRWRASTGSTRGTAALHVYFLGRTSNPEAALDLLQEAFLRAWRNAPTLRALSPERQRYWLSAVARNLVVDRHRGLVSRRDAWHRAAADPRWTRKREAGPQAALESRERLEDDRPGADLGTLGCNTATRGCCAPEVVLPQRPR